jgi:hypothetical protein
MQRDDKLDELDETLKPDIPRPHEKRLRPEEALREARDTYGDDSASPNREDQEDMHHGASDE